MLVMNSNKYHGLKLKNSEELIPNTKPMKEAKFRKRKFNTTEIQEAYSIEQKVSKFMVEKSMSKFYPYLAVSDLKDFYFL